MKLEELLGKALNTSIIPAPIQKAADFVTSKTENTLDDKAVSTVKEYTTPKAIAGGANSLAKMLANSLATFTASAGDYAARTAVYGGAKAAGNEELAQKAVTQKTGARELPGPIGKWIGPITTYADSQITRREEGQGPIEASLKTLGTAALDSPVGIELKPIFVGGSVALKQGLKEAAPIIEKIAASKSVSNITKWLGDIIKGGEKAEVSTLAKQLVDADTPELVTKTIDDAVKTSGKLPEKPEISKLPKEKIPENISLPEDQRFVNTVNRMKITDKQKTQFLKEVENVRQGLEEYIGAPITKTDVINKSKEIEPIINKAFTREEQLEQMANYKSAMDTMAEVMQRGSINRRELAEVLKFVEATKTYYGRGLNNIKQIGESTNPSMKLFIKIAQDLEKQGKTMEDILKASEKYDLDTVVGQQGLYRELANSNWEKWFDKLRMNSMLSSPSTHAINTLSNVVGIGVLNPLTKAVAGGIDAARSALTGSERTQFAGEVLPYVKEYVNPKNWKEGWQNAVDAIKGVQSFDNVDLRTFDLTDKKLKLLSKEDLAKNPKEWIKSQTEKALDFFPRMSSAVDSLVGTFGEAGEKAALQYRKDMGVAVGNIEKLAKESVDKQVFRGKLVDEADGAATKAIGAMTQAIQHGSYSNNAPVRILSKMLTPFMKTAGNIIKTGVQYTPVGVLDLIGAKNKTEVVAKVAVGSAIMSALYKASQGGYVTSSYPTSKTERKLWEQNGIQPYSAYINGRWVSYEKLHPAIAFPIALMSGIQQKVREGEYSEETAANVGSAAFISMLKFIGSQGYARSFGSLIGAMNGDEQEASKVLSSVPSQLIPFRALLSWVDRITTDVQAKASDDASGVERIMQNILNQMPDFIAEPADFKTDSYGKALPNPSKESLGGGFLNAIGIKNTPSPEGIVEDIVGYGKASAAMKAFNDKDKKTKAEVDKLIKTVQNLKSKEERVKLVSEFLQSNPEAAEKLSNSLKAQTKKAGLSMEETKIMGMSRKEKAEYIKLRISKMKRGEAIEYVKSLAEKGVID